VAGGAAGAAAAVAGVAVAGVGAAVGATGAADAGGGGSIRTLASAAGTLISPNLSDLNVNTPSTLLINLPVSLSPLGSVKTSARNIPPAKLAKAAATINNRAN
jgi:hypothetical protein